MPKPTFLDHDNLVTTATTDASGSYGSVNNLLCVNDGGDNEGHSNMVGNNSGDSKKPSNAVVSIGGESKEPSNILLMVVVTVRSIAKFLTCLSTR
jgi:hypothetical protein